MSRITDITVNKNIINAYFHTSLPAEAAALRRALLNDIETYAIDIVTFDVNTTSRHDELIAFRLGQLVIDHTKYNYGNNFKTHVSFTGPGVFNTSHIIGIPFKYETPIMTLIEGQKLELDVIIVKDIGRTHAKWRPVGSVGFKQEGDKFLFTIGDIGMMTAEDILTKGLEKIQSAANAPYPNKFFKPVAFQ
jgi:DNA-directed RNA polymerase subunit D